MIETILLGIASSTAAEFVTWLNKKLQNTTLAGDAAFILALVMALVGGVFKVFVIDHTPISTLTWPALSAAFAEVWTISQVFFMFVTRKLNLDVQQPQQ